MFDGGIDGMAVKQELTLGILNKLTFVEVMHLDGGNGFSFTQTYNKEYGLHLCERTDGSPHYRYTQRYLTTDDDSIQLNLMLSGQELEKAKQDFITAYNKSLES